MALRQRFSTFYSASANTELKDSSGTAFGQSITEYQIYRRTDVANLKNVKGYYLQAKQRLVIPNPNGYALGAETQTSYKNYPAIIQNELILKLNNAGTARISQVFPRTLNSQVTINSSSATGQSSSTSHQTTSGSSTSNVNTFGVSLSAGFFGSNPVGDLGLSYTHSWIRGSSIDNTTGGAAQSSQDNSLENTMSVKDWSAFSQLSDDNLSLSWIWGQSYPWDVILYNHTSSGDNIALPQFIQDRMVSDGLVLPPSELSLFGLDFTAQASWLIDFPEGVKENETVSISHETTSFSASHSVEGNDFSARLQSSTEASTASYSTGELDLSLYSLSPIGGYPAEEPATIGFKLDPFTYSPASDADPFKIVSATNDIQVTGTGFDEVMTSTFKTDPSLTINFKISNTNLDYELVLTHWTEGDDDCQIDWSVNDKFTGSTRLGKNVSSEGQTTSTRLPLRNRDYESLNYQDYLVIGLNKIKIKITPIANNGVVGNNNYTLSSVTIR